MHQVNPRFKPGGRKKLCDGLVAQDATLLFLQVSRFYRLKKAQEKIDFCGAGGHPPHPPPFFFYFIFLIIQDAKDAEDKFLLLSVDPLKTTADKKDTK